VTAANVERGVALTLAGTTPAAIAEVVRRAAIVAKGQTPCATLGGQEGALRVPGATLKVEPIAAGAVFTVAAATPTAVEQVRARATDIQKLNAKGTAGCGLCTGECGAHGGGAAAPAGAAAPGAPACPHAAGAAPGAPACPHAAGAAPGAPACPHAAPGGSCQPGAAPAAK
jgi:hypothetical protein